MNMRIDPFGSISDAPIFETKPKREKPVEQTALERIAVDNNFPSRQAPRIVKEPKRKRRLHTTGRNRQFNIKVTDQTLDRFYRLADEKQVTLCKLLELSLDALERAGG